MAVAPGLVRDAVIGFLETRDEPASVKEILDAVSASLGRVSPSSVRSYLTLNVPSLFSRTERGKYSLSAIDDGNVSHVALAPAVTVDKASLYHANCMDWLRSRDPNSIHAVVTDPPYGLVEYSERELTKLREGNGGIWRIPPAFDGHRRAPLPRFTVLSAQDRVQLHSFFNLFAKRLRKVLVPGANVVVASNPLLSHLVASAMSDAGLELRGTIVRLSMTMRGGDRPKNAHHEFSSVSVMPRSMWEPWVVLRKPLEGRVQDNLRKWKTGGFRRISDDLPFGDVIKSSPTPRAERLIAPHPSLKPQSFLRRIVRGSLPLGEGVVLDPFAGSGSTLAAANALGYESIGVEADPKFVRLADEAIAKLSTLTPR
ncbi:DNA methyltransferase [Sphingosinicella sp. LHD-64]|uniref:DNA methyltransferase n=1 Tax=Sphingosinicella sp. LHD-64 TaxID=3072139 RepID=UPI00280C91FE|nr:DNA methyltransferase [Sphingosinicella sp. LHD-64]MDQ8755818.1 DNA methyltransferase [Sphingosinicella sp. LHD-64]